MNPEPDASNPARTSRPTVYIVIAVLITISVLAAYFYRFHGNLSSKPEEWGQFGDYIGGVLNPIFGLGGFIALLFTFFHQRDQLEATTRHVKAQAGTAKLQAFESTFFQLLTLYRDVTKDLRITRPFAAIDNPNSPGELEGRECLRFLHKELLARFLSPVERGDIPGPTREAVRMQYKKFYEEYGHLVGHYFRTIYNLVKFVSRAELTPDAKKIYTNLLRAQLSKYELGLLAYNCASEFGDRQLAPLVEEFDLLKHLEDSALSNPEHRVLAGAF